jgi:hypothetical protein
MSSQLGVESPKIAQILEVLEDIRKANPSDIAEVTECRKQATKAVSKSRGIDNVSGRGVN